MILTDENLLRVKCEDVQPEEIDSLRTLLEEELRKSAEAGRPGVGLAAPQIGIQKRMAIIRVPVKDSVFALDIVNLKPENIKGYDRFIFDGEGCLSFPDRYERTWRYREIYVTNNGVSPHNFVLTGFPAVVVQHEQDHLDGIVFLERMLASR